MSAEREVQATAHVSGNAPPVLIRALAELARATYDGHMAAAQSEEE